jgi:type I restriction enzyme S subunit
MIKVGYKQTEIGVIPVEWEVSRMANLFSFKNGVNADKTSYGYGTKFINVMDVFNYEEIRSVNVLGKVKLNTSQIRTYKVSKHDILFNRTSETFEEIALASIYLDEEEVVFGGVCY